MLRDGVWHSYDKENVWLSFDALKVTHKVADVTCHCARPSRPNVTGKFAIFKKFRFVSAMGIGRVLDIRHLRKKRKPVHIIFPHARKHK